MAKKLLFEKDARDALMKGCEIMYKSVGSTYSPKGRNVAIQRPWGAPLTHHDGVSVAKEVGDENVHVQMGIDMIRGAAETQVLESADGTTATTILAYHLTKKSLELLDKKINPMVLRKQMNAAIEPVIKSLKDLSVPIETRDQIKHIATVSARDEELAELVVQAFEKVGTDGQIITEEGQHRETKLDYIEGMQINKGYAAQIFVTDPARMQAIVEDAIVVVVSKKLSLAKEIGMIFEAVIQLTKNKNIVIFGDVTGDALQACIINKYKGNLNILVVDPPQHGDRRQDILGDIALVTGARPIMDILGTKIAANDFGHAKKIVADKITTVVLGGRMAESDVVKKKIDDLRTARETTASIYDKERFEERLAKLTTGVAVIRVGAKTEGAVREIVEQVKDAVGAVRAAKAEGIVAGGAVSMVRIREVLDPKKDDGTRLVYETLAEPLKKLLLNSGQDDLEIFNKILNAKNKNDGYNADTDKIEDLLTKGIIDPAKVIRTAIENAVNVAGMIITTDCLIAEVPDVGQAQE